MMTARLWRELGIAQHVRLELNSIGSLEARANYRTALIDYLEQYQTYWMKIASAACTPTRCVCLIRRILMYKRF